jgi:hypothetical protein
MSTISTDESRQRHDVGIDQAKLGSRWNTDREFNMVFYALRPQKPNCSTSNLKGVGCHDDHRHVRNRPCNHRELFIHTTD